MAVMAKMDLVEVRAARAEVGIGEADDLFAALEVRPVDYKAGAPRERAETNEVWDADRIPLGLHGPRVARSRD